MLTLNEKGELPIKLEWFNHLSIYNEKYITIEFQD